MEQIRTLKCSTIYKCITAFIYHYVFVIKFACFIVRGGINQNGNINFCTCTWTAKLLSSVVISPQIMHLYSALRAWISAWARRSRASGNDSPQTLHTWPNSCSFTNSSLMWTLSCRLKLSCLKVIWQIKVTISHH